MNEEQVIINATIRNIFVKTIVDYDYQYRKVTPRSPEECKTGLHKKLKVAAKSLIEHGYRADDVNNFLEAIIGYVE